MLPLFLCSICRLIGFRAQEKSLSISPGEQIIGLQIINLLLVAPKFFSNLLVTHEFKNKISRGPKCPSVISTTEATHSILPCLSCSCFRWQWHLYTMLSRSTQNPTQANSGFTSKDILGIVLLVKKPVCHRLFFSENFYL